MRMKKARVRVSGVTRSHSHTNTVYTTHTHTLTPCRQSLQRLIWAVLLPLRDTPPRERDGLTNSPWQLINKWQSQSGLTRSRVCHLPPCSQGYTPINHTQIHTQTNINTWTHTWKCPITWSNKRFTVCVSVWVWVGVVQVTEWTQPLTIAIGLRMAQSPHLLCVFVNLCSFSLSVKNTNQYLWPTWEA